MFFLLKKFPDIGIWIGSLFMQKSIKNIVRYS